MAYCKNCGAQVAANDKHCPYCGAAQSNPAPASNNGYQAQNPNDTGSIGWGILGFCFPIVGLILFLIWNKDKPNNARSAGIGALIGFLLGLGSGIFTGLLGGM